jgi:peroxiredoxin
MKTLFILAVIFLSLTFVSAQTEQAPIQEKELSYKNWTFQSVRGDAKINLRDFAKDKKLVLVVYFASWCPNWKHEAPFAQKLHEKYSDKGLAVIGVSEYDTLEATRKDLQNKGITFPVVFESDSREAKQKTTHYEYRKAVGDTRNWGSPWNIIFSPKKMKKDGDVLIEKAFIANGELIEAEAEKFVREQLGLKPENDTAQKSVNQK